ncbi:flagellar hook-length control protein FliK [Stakelama tenebrarum]|uniref:Flagellar hook-length control protein-like C-terminal domain-containing protein n=1 Tax=Stakelama tenebrarum TaxID=2711215 RepID=A0A6G6Y1C3_9SPHN|nr:flagellar hook-length control protein FliK [Sphingosinithalassobacter tenebrarum]QIG78725.1 hypothetical protein G5C33_02250 [Sphingosinithalassobacter tenebrarum]
MIQIAANSVAGPAMFQPGEAPLSAGSSEFALAFASAGKLAAPMPGGKLAASERLAIAGGGKILPEAAKEAGDESGDTGEADAATVPFGWIAPALAVETVPVTEAAAGAAKPAQAPPAGAAPAREDTNKALAESQAAPFAGSASGGADPANTGGTAAQDIAPALRVATADARGTALPASQLPAAVSAEGAPVSDSAARTAAAPLPPFGGTAGSGPQGNIVAAATSSPPGGAPVAASNGADGVRKQGGDGKAAVRPVVDAAPARTVDASIETLPPPAIRTGDAPQIQLAATASVPANPLVRDIMPRALAGDWSREDARNPASRSGGAAGIETLIAGRPTVIDTRSVAAAADAGAMQLDTRRDQWIEDMIDHIDVLRDANGTRTARLRLTPDALGRLDISVQRQGDSLHVRIDAHEHAARTMIADAAPRLAELAEARGMRLSHGFSDAAAGQSGTNMGGGHGSAPQNAPRRPDAPASARGAAAATDSETADRIA